MKWRYRIYTEDKDDTRFTIIDRAGTAFESFNVSKPLGFWKGKAEAGLVLEIITDLNTDAGIYLFAKWIKDFNKQETVLITREPVEAELV